MIAIKSSIITTLFIIFGNWLFNAAVEGKKQEDLGMQYYRAVMKDRDSKLDCPVKAGSILAYESRCPGNYDFGGEFSFRVDDTHAIHATYKRTGWTSK